MTTIEQSRHLATAIPGPKSTALMDRKTGAVARGVGTTMPVFAARAGGGIVEDVDGNRLIDLGSGIAVTTIGNASPRVVLAVGAQAAEFTHTCFTVTPYEGYVAVCEHLNRLTPVLGEKRSALFNSGAEAVENSVKIARAHTGKQAVVAFDHGYHGRTNLTMALTAKSMPYKHGFGPFAPEIYRAPMSYPFRDAEFGKELATDGELAAQRALTVIDKQIGAANLAALVIEPIQGEGGFIVPAEGFLPTLLDWCRKNDVVFIADEVQTGFARTGAMFACEHEGIDPDLIVTAKGIADGLPLAAVTGRADIMDSPHVGGLGGTYGGNPVACAAALATIETIESEGMVARAREIETLMKGRLGRMQADDDRIGDVRGRGAMIAVELVKSGTTEPDGELTKALSAGAHAAGVIVLTCGTFGNVLRFLPPLTSTDELLEEGLDVLALVLKDL
ncbi:aspartate aminotransferase family protein [Mycolicibacterium madagascariense]|uniref:(S)-3-amino-2-methylpropionate transaminase n=1 Tax=Mycolicibacterium madagascariense TaxID=212765 RepID=A0A7I7XG86_9MYCO|nr:4-aminobutyrate--2-oxoglutarate transaminase [Mycolicibacterium madagascariense]MCV7013200.1 4-aminobutyrate--2-oxoglutarate transaminase [Mycolicibacterium madagascariense]BBZ28196.1 aspartate aminotransferase family protein [Mycolicibacterium madagascariense]